MKCCEKCFKDAEIIDIIKNQKTKGKCSFCNSKSISVYDLQNDTILSEMFGELLEAYTIASDLPDTFPKENLDLLRNILHTQWSIFNVGPDCIYKLITNICHEKYKEQPELFDTTVGILESQDKEYLRKHSILRDNKWSDFVNDIKKVNRFHTDHINKDVLKQFMQCMVKTYRKNIVFYRARICKDENGFKRNEMGAPPTDLATAGRINPAGIRVLYLADSIKTTLHETRAGIFDYVTVGNFKIKKEIEVINFANLDKISPFIANNNMGIEYTQYAVNLEQLKFISQEIAKPLRRQDSELDYLPTQYISDYIKEQGFDGVEYSSTMREGGINIALFNSDEYKCTKATVYQIKSISYDEKEVK